MDYDLIQRWSDELRRRLSLTRPQADVLALWTVGVVSTRTCGLTTVCAFLALGLGRSFRALRSRLREFCYEASAKRGAQRRALDVEECFASLLRWVLSLGHGPHLALALDATSLKQNFVVLSISVLFAGTAIPVAWHVVRGGEPDAWQPHWCRLIERLRPAIPEHYFVLALTDRGLYAPWLFRALTQAGWHPLMRINAQGYFTPKGQRPRLLSAVVSAPGQSYRAEGQAFKENPLSCTLVAHWEEGYDEPWRLLTDLAPSRVEARWYGLRAWIEQGFKDVKRGGFQWHLTRMRDPERVKRLWLVLAVATLWTVSLGAAAQPAAPAPPKPSGGAARSGTSPTAPFSAASPGRARSLSVSRLGWLDALVQLMRGTLPLPQATLRPQPWPPAFGACSPSPG